MKFESYYGGKSGAGVYQTIINQIPPHINLIVGFLGHCGITRNIQPARNTIGYDLDQQVIERWEQYLAKNPQYNMTLYKESFIDRLYTYTPFINIGDTVVYLDPPYLHDSRKDPRNRYKYEMSHKDHKRLVTGVLAIKEPNVKFAISHYPHPLYDSLLDHPGWRYIDFQAQTRRGMATERLYMNYPEPTRLHDYSYLGDNYKERERIKLKFERWKNNYHQLPPLERAMRYRYVANLTQP